MEWNDHAYIIVYFRNGRLPRCAHAQQIDLLPAACHTKKERYYKLSGEASIYTEILEEL